MNRSDWLMSVTVDIKEPLLQLCGSILNWDCGAESGFTYERRGISQGHKNRRGREVPKWNLDDPQSSANWSEGIWSWN